LYACQIVCLSACLSVYQSVCLCMTSALFQQCMLLQYVPCTLACLVGQKMFGKQICLLKAGMAQPGSRMGSALHQLHELKYRQRTLICLTQPSLTISMPLSRWVLCSCCLYVCWRHCSALCATTAQHLSCIMSDTDGSGWSCLEGATT